MTRRWAIVRTRAEVIEVVWVTESLWVVAEAVAQWVNAMMTGRMMTIWASVVAEVAPQVAICKTTKGGAMPCPSINQDYAQETITGL